MTVFDILTLVFGLSLFLFGMNLMGDTLKKSAGRRLKMILGRMTGNPLGGFALGLAVTAIIQSSSATTVMVVGFVSSGTMLLSQAVPVIMGANVGTTVTSWLTALSGMGSVEAVGSVMQWFKPSAFTPIIALTGLVFYMSGKSDKKKNLGLILLGFSVLMIGMETMSDSVSGLSENESFRSILLMFENPMLGVFAGLIMTATVQSSSASIGILQSFTATGAITFGNAVPIILGQNVGTCVTALISSAGASRNAKRSAMVHLYFNLFGSAICLGIFYALRYVSDLPFLNGGIDMWGIAMTHTVFNVVTVIALFPFRRQLERLSVLTVKERAENDGFSMLDEHLIATPSVAIDRSREAVIRMAELSLRSVDLSCALIWSYDERYAQKVRDMENMTDEYEDRLGTYLVRISEESILDTEKKEATKLLHMIGDIERISDHAVNIAESSEEINDKRISFSLSAREELCVLVEAVKEINQLSFCAICENDLESAAMVEPLEQVIDGLRDEIKRRHIGRLQRGECTIEQGFVLTDILTDLERVADHCSNLAGCYIEMSRRNAMDMHKYLKEYRNDNSVFDDLFRRYSEKYAL